MNKFKHLMIDLEVMAKKPDGAIAAIAAVPFDMVSGVTDDALFYEVVDLRSSAGLGGSIDADTVLWWLGKSDQTTWERYQQSQASETASVSSVTLQQDGSAANE